MDRSSTLGSQGLRSIINHLVLPPRLPGCREESLHFIEDGLARRLRDASRVLREHTRDESSQRWDTLCSSIQTCRRLNDGGKLDNSTLLTEFSRLEKKILLILQVTEQNAGLLIRGEYATWPLISRRKFLTFPIEILIPKISSFLSRLSYHLLLKPH